MREYKTPKLQIIKYNINDILTTSSNEPIKDNSKPAIIINTEKALKYKNRPDSRRIERMRKIVKNKKRLEEINKKYNKRGL